MERGEQMDGEMDGGLDGWLDAWMDGERGRWIEDRIDG